MAAFAAANAAILAENRPFAGARGNRRICVGATAIAIDGRAIAVAQAPPSQAILVQDGQVYAFPDLASWRGDYAPEEPEPEAHPLGFAEDTAPRLYVSAAAPGDLVALCSSSVGRVLGRDEAAVFNLFGGSLLTSDLEGSVDRLERLIAPDDIRDAFAVVVALARLTGRRGPRAHLFRSRPDRRRRPTHWPPHRSCRCPRRRQCRSTTALPCSRECATGRSTWRKSSLPTVRSRRRRTARASARWRRQAH